MDEFTDGLNTAESDETIIDDTPDTETPVSEPETPEQSSPVSDSADLTDEPEELTEPEQTTEAPAQTTETPAQTTDAPEQEVAAGQEVSYDDLMKELSAQTEDIKAMREIVENRQDFYDNVQNMGLVIVAAGGLICGCICALILANYLRH